MCGAIRAFVADLCGQLDAAFATGIEQSLGRLLDEIIPRAAYALGREAMQAVLSECRGFAGTKLECDKCRHEAWESGSLEFHEYRTRNVVTRLGSLRTSRAYYHCPRGHSATPLDELLGLNEHGVLPEVQQFIAELASQMPFAEARSTFQRLAPATLAVSTVESITATVANEVQQEQQREIDEAFCPATSRFPVAEQTPKGKFAVVASDGGMCRIKKQDQYSEFKVGVLGTVDPSSHDEDRVREKSYVATLGNCDRIFQQIHIEFARKGLDRCSLLQFLGDGADWIWRRARASSRRLGRDYF